MPVHLIIAARGGQQDARTFAGPIGGVLQCPWTQSSPYALSVRLVQKTKLELLAAGAREWGLTLSPRELEAFQLYYEQLLSWNERINLTSVTGYEEVQTKHFLDSLSCLQVLDPLCHDVRCIDIGAGAGFPGLPLRIVRTFMRLTLLEATAKKACFLEHLVGELGLSDVDVLTGRAEDLGQRTGYRETFDVALARAVAGLSVLVEYALPLVRVGGVFVAQKGPDVQDEVDDAERGLELLGGRLLEIKRVWLPGVEAARHLVVVQKESETPAKYPRRPGIPTKRPLRDL
jgi:16S rRNA (guanine527-N7)-methyltransferase